MMSIWLGAILVILYIALAAINRSRMSDPHLSFERTKTLEPPRLRSDRDGFSRSPRRQPAVARQPEIRGRQLLGYTVLVVRYSYPTGDLIAERLAVSGE
jgi:hypothetical protein